MIGAKAPCILGDWGSTRLRLRLMGSDGNLAEVEGPGLFAAGAPPPDVLAVLLAQLDPTASATDVLLCGMAGARGGLIEAAYLPCPADVLAWAGKALSSVVAGRRVTVLPGLSTRDAAGNPEVMRGEEAQIFGALAANPELAEGDHLFVLPGTHSKWVTVQSSRIAGFATAMTGELHARLLGSSLAAAGPIADPAAETAGFVAGARRGLGGEPLARALFGGRSGQLADGQTPDWARGYLSGCLIGSEVAGFRSGLSDCKLILIGEGDLIERYRQVFAVLGAEALLLSGEDCVFKGLEVARGITG